MTICMAWIHRGRGYIVADSVLTSTGAVRPLPVPHTAFGEHQLEAPTRTVAEGAIKVFALTDAVLAGYSGSVVDGIASLIRLRRTLLGGRTPRDAVAAIQDATGGSRILVVGYELGAVHIWLVGNGAIEERYEDGAIQILASLPPSETNFATSTVRAISEMPGTTADYLAAVIVGLQAHGQAANLLTHGVGGAFWGYMLDDGAATPGSDILYVLYDRHETAEHLMNLTNARLVMTGVRGEVGFAWQARRAEDPLRFFVPDVQYTSDDEVRAMVPTIVRAQVNYLALVERIAGSVLLCQRDNPDQTDLFSIAYTDHETTFHLDTMITDRLHQVPTREVRDATGEAPFDFIRTNEPPGR